MVAGSRESEQRTVPRDSSAGLELRRRVRRVAGHATRLVRLHAVSRFVATVGICGLTIGLLDYRVRFDDFGTRLFWFAIFSAVLLGAAWRYLVRAWRYRCSELQAARRIESTFPRLRDRLSSAVAFVREADHEEVGVSEELRQVVIREAARTAERTDFGECLEHRGPLRALLVASVVAAIFAVLWLANGSSVRIAAQRLLLPWADRPWPRRHVLQWVDAPRRLAAGQDFEVKLVDANGELPEQVAIHYWFEGDPSEEIRTYEMQPLGESVVHRQANVSRNFRYRATGGDDQQMPWRTLSLVEPPRALTVEVTLDPPDYAALPTRQVAGDFRALVGARAGLTGRSDKPLAAAYLETESGGEPQSTSLVIGDDRKTFSLDPAARSWLIKESGQYGVRLVSADRFDPGVLERWQVTAVRDAPPTVSLTTPAADQMVTPSARLSVAAIVKEDLAIDSIDLHFVRGGEDDAEEERLNMWKETPSAGGSASATQRAPGEGVQREIEYVWDLSRTQTGRPGEWIDFRVVATDRKSQSGSSAVRRVTFITPERLAETIAQKQSTLLDEIVDILRIQRETRLQTSELETQVRDAGLLHRGDIDELQVVELNQRRIRRRLADPADGVAARITALIAEVDSNRLDNPELLERLGQFQQSLRNLDRQHLAPVEYRLVDAVKIARQAVDSQADAATPIDERSQTELLRQLGPALENQQGVIESLQTLLDRLAQWDNYQRLAREAARLRREQETVQERTAELRNATVGRERSDLPPRQLAELEKLTARQNEVALAFSTLAQAMGRMEQQSDKESPQVATTLRAALEQMREAGTAGMIREAGRQIQRNRLGRALESHEEILRQLRRLEDLLANRDDRQAERRLEELRAAGEQLEDLRTRQNVVRRETAAAKSPEEAEFARWSREEAEIARQLGPLVDDLRGHNPSSAEKLQTALEKLREAAEAADRRALKETRQAAETASKLLDSATQTVARTRDAVAQRRRDARMNALVEKLRQWNARQEQLVEQALQLPVAADPPDDLPRSRSAAWQRVAADQLRLSRQIVSQQAQIDEIESFSFVLGNAAEWMEGAATLLQNAGEGMELEDAEVPRSRAAELLGEVNRRQRNAGEILQQLLAAVVDQTPSGKGRPGGREQKGEGSESPGGARYLLPQLKLIRSLQKTVNLRTRELEKEPQPWNTSVEEEYAELLDQQRRLAELVRQLIAPSEGSVPKEEAEKPQQLDPLDSLEKALEGEDL